jgi:hypothetical protein
MTKQEQKEFLSRPTDGNIMRLAQAILAGDPHIRWQITHAMRNLAKYSFVKDLTVGELFEAVNMISEKKI